MAIEFKDLAKMKWYYQVLIVAGVCGALLAGVWYQFLTPINTEITAKTAKLTEVTQVVTKARIRALELAKMRADAEKLQKDLDTLRTALPTEKETDQIFRAVQLQAAGAGLKVSRVAPRALIDHEFYTEYPIDLDVTGTYHNVGAFLDRIRQLPRIVNINGLRLQGRASQGDAAFTSSVGATYTATTFVYKDETLASSAPPPKTVK